MQRFLSFVAVVAFASPAFAYDLPAVKYPPGASLAAIAVNEQIRLEIAGTPGVVSCRLIDTSDPHGRCLDTIIPNAGDGGAAGASAGASGGK